MAITIERCTDNPYYKVALGLALPQTIESITLDKAQLETLSEDAQKCLARLQVSCADNDGKIAMRRYVPQFHFSPVNEVYFANYKREDLDVCFSDPIPFTIELVMQWIGHLAVRHVLAENEARQWVSDLNTKQKTLLDNPDDDVCYKGLRQMIESNPWFGPYNSNYFIKGPAGVEWRLSSEACNRLSRIERVRKAAEEEREEAQKAQRRAEQEQLKKQRIAFVKAIVEEFGDIGQKARLNDNLLPAEEIASLVHYHVLGDLSEYRCPNNAFDGVDGIVKLNQERYDRFVLFREKAKEQRNSTVVASVDLVFGKMRETDETIPLCEITVSDNNSNWENTRWYYLDLD